MNTKTENFTEILCSGCLCSSRMLNPISDERLQQYYQKSIHEVPLNISTINPNLCYVCEALLRKAYEFLEQVKDSYRILQSYYSEQNILERLIKEVSRPPRLTVKTNQSISINPEVKIEIEEVNVGEVFLKREEWHESEGDGMNESQLDYEYISEEFVDTDAPKHKKRKNRKTKATSKRKSRKVKLEVKKDETDLGKQLNPVDDVTERERETADVKSERKNVKSTDSEKKTQKNIKEELNEEYQIKILTYDQIESERNAISMQLQSAEFKCLPCLQQFNTESMQQRHKVKYHDEKIGDYVCPVCQRVIASLDTFMEHCNGHLKRYECNTCKHAFENLNAFKKHYVSKHVKQRTKLTCKQCGKVSCSPDAHRYHAATQHRARLQCGKCAKTFRHRVGLANHTMVEHGTQNSFPCEQCGKVLKWKSSLRKHLEVHHKRPKPAAAHCVPCGVSFGSTASYRRHLQSSMKHVARGDLRFICDHCDARFSNKTKVRDHIEELHLHKKYQCHICLKPSKNRVTLDQHIRNVHIGRPHNKMCHLCGKGFPTKLQLDSHIRSHTGEKPFICEFCPSTFTQHGNLYKHYRHVHQNNKPPIKENKSKVQVTDGQTNLQMEFSIQ